MFKLSLIHIYLFAGTYAQPVMEALGEIAFQYVFCREPILKLEIAAETIFRFLLDRFVDAAIYYDTGHGQSAVQEKLMALISDNYKGIYHIYAKDRDSTEKLYLRCPLSESHSDPSKPYTRISVLSGSMSNRIDCVAAG